MLLEVAARVLANDVVDYIAFRGACTPSPCDPTLRVLPARPVDWVPLCDAACEMALFNTRTPRSLRVRLPELKGHRIIGFTDGLVILLNKRTAAVRMLHPFTRVAVDFPSLVPVYHRLIKRRGRVLRMGAAVCSSASSAASIAVVAWFPWTPVVLSAEAGHASWEVVHEDMELSTALPFNGQLYGVVQSAWQILQVYPPRPEPLPPVVVADIPHQFNSPGLYHYYLVESDGFMLLVVQSRDVERWQRYNIDIFHVDVSLRHPELQLARVTGFDDQAFFVSGDRSLCVSTKNLPSISGNSVYLALRVRDPAAVYSLSSRSFERPTTSCQVHDGRERIRPSVRPFTLADHLRTYCNHYEWANGLMFHEYYSIPKSFEELWKKIRAGESQVRIPRLED